MAQADERIDVVRRQAGSQMKEYERILDESVSQDAVIKDLRGQITKLEEQVKASAAKVKNSEILVKQAEATRKEYMRLSDDYASMEKRIGLTGPAETKKDAWPEIYLYFIVLVHTTPVNMLYILPEINQLATNEW